MALKPCRECKKEVSTEAATCPSCGVPNPTAKKTIVNPWGDEQKKSQIKSAKSKPNYEYSRCVQAFCTYKYALVPLEETVCGTCGNSLEKVTKEDGEKYLKYKYPESNINNSQTTQSKVQQNIIEKIWWGNETLGTIFWMYCILTVAVVSFVSGFASGFVGVIIFVIPVLVIIWTNTGLWRCSEKYKSSQLKRNQSYGWATAAKVYVVLNYITMLSQLGLLLDTMQPL